jgi:hypothetical protein
MGILLNKSKNYIINGAMDYWQRNISFAAAATNTYTADRWEYRKNGTMVHTVSRDVDVPTFAQSGVTFPYSLNMTLTTPQALIGVADSTSIQTTVEGQVFAPLKNKEITISFWVKATLAGQYSVAFRNSGIDWVLVRSYVVNSSNTWEKKTLTITHNDSSGTWNYTTGVGLEVRFTIASGTNVIAPSENVWSNGNYIAVSGQVNGVAAGSTNFKITGIQLEEGQSASNFERAGNNTINELRLCQRYYEKSYSVNTIPGTITGRPVDYQLVAGNEFRREVQFRVDKRVAPTGVVYNATTGAINGIRVEGANYTGSTSGASETGMQVRASTTTVAGDGAYEWTADAEL